MSENQPQAKMIEEILDQLVIESHNRVVKGDSMDIAVLWPIAEAKQAIEYLTTDRERVAKIDCLTQAITNWPDLSKVDLIERIGRMIDELQHPAPSEESDGEGRMEADAED